MRPARHRYFGLSSIRCAVGVAAVAICVSTGSPASGAESDKAAARAHYEAATRLYDIKEWAKALDEYKAAYLAKPDPAFLFNIGQCYRKLAKPAQALEFYREYLKKAPADDSARATVEARVREMEAGDLFESDGAARPSPGPAQQATPVPQVPPQAQPIEATPVGEAPAEPSAPGELIPAAPPFPQPAHAPAPTQPVPLTRTVSEPPTVPGVDLSATTPSPAAESAPVYKTWWLWTGVGAVVVGGTVVAILAASSGSHGNTANTALGTQPVFQ